MAYRKLAECRETREAEINFQNRKAASNGSQ
jgi:hypothetical protein